MRFAYVPLMIKQGLIAGGVAVDEPPVMPRVHLRDGQELMNLPGPIHARWKCCCHSR